MSAAALATPDAGLVPAVPGKAPFDRQTASYSYVLVRSDLSLEQQMVQAIHAAMKSVGDHGRLQDDTRLALLSVKDQAHLLQCAGELADAGIPFSLFEEPDYAMGASALATAPGPALRLKCLKKLPLLKGPGSATVGVRP